VLAHGPAGLAARLDLPSMRSRTLRIRRDEACGPAWMSKAYCRGASWDCDFTSAEDQRDHHGVVQIPAAQLPA